MLICEYIFFAAVVSFRNKHFLLLLVGLRQLKLVTRLSVTVSITSKIAVVVWQLQDKPRNRHRTFIFAKSLHTLSAFHLIAAFKPWLVCVYVNDFDME